MKNNYTLFSVLLWGPQRRKPKVGLNRRLGHSGFMLIELIIATLIASMIGTLLLTILYQSNQMQVAVDDMIDISERMGIVSNVLEKDLAGAFVPTQSEQKNDMQNKLAEQSENADKKTAEKKDTGSPQTPAKKEKKPIEKIFYSTNKNGMLDTLTFVTNNPLVVFVGKDVGVVKPKIVRVQYTVKPDPENKDSYSLFRQESNELDLAEYKNVRPYEVISGIKKLTVTFTARIEKKQEQKEGQQTSSEKQSSSAKATADTSSSADKKKEYEYKKQPEWVSEQKEDKNKESEKKESEFPRIPYSVEFKITLWDKPSKKEKEFIVVCSIPVDSIEAQQKDKKQPAAPKKEPQKPANGSDKSKQGQPSEVVVYNETEILSNALNSLKKLLGHG